MYTDDVSEANILANALYGTKRMVDALNRLETKNLMELKGILDTLRQNMDRFVDDAEQLDDLTMMCLHFNG